MDQWYHCSKCVLNYTYCHIAVCAIYPPVQRETDKVNKRALVMSGVSL